MVLNLFTLISMYGCSVDFGPGGGGAKTNRGPDFFLYFLRSQGSAGASILCKFLRAGEQGREPRRVRVHFGVAREAVRVHFF